MIKRKIIRLHYDKLALPSCHSIFNYGKKFNRVVLVVAGGAKKTQFSRQYELVRQFFH
jgi:hypothetical protein